MKKRLIAMIAALAMAAGVFSSCAQQANTAGKAYNLQEFAGGSGQGILAPVINSKGQLVAASQTEGAPVVLTTYDASGNKVSDSTTQITQTAARFTLDAKDNAYILTDENVYVLDPQGKTVSTIPMGGILSKASPGVTQSASESVTNQAAMEKQSQATGGANAATAPETQGLESSGQNQPAQNPEQNTLVQMNTRMINGFAASSDGSIFLSMLGAGVVQVDTSGKQVRSYGGSGINLICMNENEQLMVYSSGENSGITAYDTQSGSQISKLEATLSNPMFMFYDRHDKRMLFMNGDGVYPVKPDGSIGDAMITLTHFSLGSTTHSFTGFAVDNEATVYIAWAEGNSSVGFGVSMKSGSRNGVSVSMPGAKADHISRLALVDASTIPQKKTLTVAGLADNSAVKAAIEAFQKAHPDYQVNLKTYSNQIVGAKGSNQLDMTSLIQQFNTDIISGNTADIYILDDLPYYKYISKGILADLGEMMAADNMDMTQYYSNIFDACRVNGKLYTLPTQFGYNMLVGKAANMPANEAPSVDDFFNMANALPAGLAALPKGDATLAFEEFMRQNYSYFVDQNAKTAKFGSQEFISLLEKFKALADSRMGGKSEEDQMPYEQVGDGILAFTSMSLKGLQDMAAIRALAGEDIQFMHMPSMEPSSFSFQASGLYGINASSPNKEMAWEFVKSLLTPEIQGGMLQMNGISVSKAAVQKAIDQLTDPKQTISMSLKTNDKVVEVKPLSVQEYAAITADFGKLNKLSAPDQNIVNILNEELPSFFSGQKSAQDAAGLIQNRVQTILDE